MPVQFDNAVGERLRFGEFELAPAARTLRRDGEEIRLGSRAFDILIALASRPGEILSKDDLTRLVWRGASVDETALRVGISAVRKALCDGGDQCITTVPGRGYCFVLDVETTTARETAEPPNFTQLKPPRLPAQLARIIGREDVIGALALEATRHRLLSLVGSGGIGKTTVAVAVAHFLRSTFDSVAFADLAPIQNAGQLAAAAAAALGLNVRPQEDPIDRIAAAVEDRHVLLVLDNCEHIIEHAAAFAEALLGAVERVTILATSRERLRAAGEWVHQLLPLDAPPKSSDLSAEEARRYPAVEMFEERAAFALGGYQISDTDAPLVAEICRRLDGIALAIELAAGRLSGLGVEGLANSVGDCFAILTHGRRTAVPRQQTLRATLDWSYRLLSPEDQSTLQCLSIFSGSFTLEEAAFVMGSADFGQANDRLTSLLDKSFVVAKPDDRRFRYYLLETTRTYAQEKLGQADEARVWRRRHAERIRSVFEQAAAEADRRPRGGWLKPYSGELGNLRGALDWSFSPEGDGATGAAIAAAAAPLLLRLSLLDEALLRVERAIAWLKDHPTPDRRLLMQLYAIAGWPQMRAIKNIPSGVAAWEETLALAVELDDIDYQLRAIWALSVDRANRGDIAESLALADRFIAVAEDASDPQDRMVGQRMRGKALHYLGDFAGSRRAIEEMLTGYMPPPQRSHVVRFQYEQRLVAQVTLVRSLWLQGSADQALAMIDTMLAEARTFGHTLTIAHILSDAACFVAFWAGDLALAERYTTMLREYTTLHALDVWHTYADAFEGEILIRREMAPHGVPLLQQAIGALKASGFVLYNPAFEGVLAEGMIACRRYEDADAVVSEAIAGCEASGVTWCLPELLRVRALGHAASGRKADALKLLAQGLRIARAQSAFAWELRLVATLADVDRGERTNEMLHEVLDRATEGFGTDVHRAAVSKLRRRPAANILPPEAAL
jgi:predicted ATPase/DNA-binding winged helix-turn-helix (wHTH) protein